MRRVRVSLGGGLHRLVFGKVRVHVCVDVGVDNVKGCFCNFYETQLHFFTFRVGIHILIPKNFKETNVKLLSSPQLKELRKPVFGVNFFFFFLL